MANLVLLLLVISHPSYLVGSGGHCLIIFPYNTFSLNQVTNRINHMPFSKDVNLVELFHVWANNIATQYWVLQGNDF